MNEYDLTEYMTQLKKLDLIGQMIIQKQIAMCLILVISEIKQKKSFHEIVA